MALQSSATGKPAGKVHIALAALESTKDAYAQELSKLKALNDTITDKFEHAKDGPLRTSDMEPLQCRALLENLLHEREGFVKELQQQKGRYEELQKELEREHSEKLEVQMSLSVLNDTIKAALQGEKFLGERNRHLVSDQQMLASKLEEVSKSRLPAFQSQIKDLESACSNMRQEKWSLFFTTKCVYVDCGYVWNSSSSVMQ